MPYANQYAKYISKEFLAVKTNLKPRNFYKIITYEYADGRKQTFSGAKSTLIFLMGITPDKKITCIKLSEVRPEKFFAWFKKLVKPALKCETIRGHFINQEFEKIIIEDTRKGAGVFSKVKTDSIYTQSPGTFRTYNIAGIKQIKTIYLDENWLMNDLLGKNCYDPMDLNKDGVVTEEERKTYLKKQNLAREEKFKL
jgi:hypothetical protein